MKYTEIVPKNLLWHFSCQTNVRISDINFAGHLAHDKIVSLLHEARDQFLHSLSWNESNINGAGIILADLYVNYKAESFFPDQLKISIAVDTMRASSCKFIYRISNMLNNTIIADAYTGIVFFDYAKRKPVRIPDNFRQKFTKKGSDILKSK